MSHDDRLTVALVVLNWNGREDADHCLTSLEMATYPELSVILVDNGSTDGSVEFLRMKHPSVSVVELDRNLGFTGGNNVGLKLATDGGFDIIGVLNNDTVVEPGFLEPLVEELEARPDGFVSPRITYLDHSCRTWFASSRVDDRTGIVYHRDEATFSEDERRATVRDEPAVTGCCLLAARATWQRVGYFDDRYFLIFEDSDWSARASALGFQARMVSTSTIGHAVGSAFATTSSAVGHYYYARNGLLYLRSHGAAAGKQSRRFVARLIGASLREARHRPVRSTLTRIRWQAIGVLDFAFGRFGARDFHGRSGG